MRSALLWNPRLLCERLAIESIRRRRLAELKRTPGASLKQGHIDTLELVKLAKEAGISVIYDVGANVGTWSLLAKSVIPAARIHAFEPLPQHQTQFVQNCCECGDVTLHSVALGPNDSDGTLHITDFSDASSVLPLADAGLWESGLREVAALPLRLVRLDAYRRRYDLPLPDLIKLDIQGYELEALKGAPECLISVKALIAEVSFIEYYKGQCLFHELAAYLAGFGLFVRAFGFSMRAGIPIGQTDALFMRTRGADLRGWSEWW